MERGKDGKTETEIRGNDGTRTKQANQNPKDGE